MQDSRTVRATAWRGALYVCVLLSVSLACTTSRSGGGLKDDPGAAGRQLVRADLKPKDFFSDSKMFYVRIRQWDPGRMDAASLVTFQDSAGAIMEIFEADAQSPHPCPDEAATDDKLLHRAGGFHLKAGEPVAKNATKTSWTIRFDSDDQRFIGMTDLILNGMTRDASQMREALALGLFRAAGLPASGHTYAKFCFNGRYQGLYGVTEAVDAAFLARRFPHASQGNLFAAQNRQDDVGPANLGVLPVKDAKNPGAAYYKVKEPGERTYAAITNGKNATYADLAALIATINGEKDSGGDREAYLKSAAYRGDVEAVLNAKLFLRWAALNMLIGGWDNYWAVPSHYYLYNARTDDKPYFVWLPWGYDQAFGVSYWRTKWQYADIVDWEGSTAAVYGGQQKASLPLIRQLLKNDAFLKYYLDAVESYATHLLTEPVMTKARGKLWEHIKKAAFLESDYPDCRNTGPSPCANTGRQFSNHEVFLQGDAQAPVRRNPMHAEGIDVFVRTRGDNVKSQLAKWRLKYPKGSSGADFSKPEPLVN